ncbi:glycosyltransferase family 39 protein [bacterium]|nr:glycosyltransferase family 39 protein [bacterium]
MRVLHSDRRRHALALVLVAAGLGLAARGQELLDLTAPYGYYYWAKGGLRALAGGVCLAAGLLFHGAGAGPRGETAQKEKSSARVAARRSAVDGAASTFGPRLVPSRPTAVARDTERTPERSEFASEGARGASPSLPRALVYSLLACVLLLALALRVPSLADVPYGLFYDEASNMHEAMRIAERGEHFVYTPANNGHPALYLYQMAGLFKLLGVTTTAARLTSALSGVLAVLLMFFLARRLFDEPTALVAAALLAVSRWHLTFSRIAFSGVQATVWPSLAVLLLWIAMRQPWKQDDAAAPTSPARLAWFGAAGAALALCLYSYSAAHVMPAVVGLFLAGLAAASPRRFWKERWGLLPATLAFVVVLAPLALYMRAHPEHLNQRAGQVWVLADVPAEERGARLADNTRRTLLSLVFAGDSNARHNLPFRRALDFATAAAAPAALAWAATQAARPAYALGLLWFLFAFMPGILSTEAPHALRTLAALPPLLLLASALLVRLCRFLAFFLPDRFFWGPAVAVALVLAVSSVKDLRVYFGPQTHSVEAWNEFEASATLAARALRDASRRGPAGLHCNLAHSLSLRMELWEDRLDVQPFRRPADWLDVDADRRQVFAHVLTSGDREAASRLRRFFPAAQIRTVADPYGRATMVLAVLEPRDYRENLGLTAHYRHGDESLARIESGESLANRGAEGFLLPPPFRAEWTGMLVLVEPVVARFAPAASGEAFFSIDATTCEQGRPIRLAAGLHRLHAAYTCEADPWFSLTWDAGSGGDMDAPLPSRVLNANPFPDRGFLQIFYDRPDWQGEPDAQDVVDAIDFEWIEVPGDSRLFSMEWRGQLTVPVSGVYEFGARAQDHAVVVVDGRMLLDAHELQRETAAHSVFLAAGRHELVVRYSDQLGFSLMQLYWRPPGGEREILPGRYVEPAW